jgi:hypothetical protein
MQGDGRLNKELENHLLQSELDALRLSERALECAQEVYSSQELDSLSAEARKILDALLKRRLRQSGPPPTPEELGAIRNELESHLVHPALGRVYSQLRLLQSRS